MSAVARRGSLALAILLLPAAAAQAQWRNSTGVRLSETYSDNVGRQSASLARENWATEISPWWSLSGKSARSMANVDLTLNNWINSNAADRNDLRGSLFGRLEAIDDFLFIDAGATKNRQQTSQFAAADAAYASPSNSSEVTRTWISPAMQWRLGNAAQARLSYRLENVDSDQSGLSGQSSTAVLNIHSSQGFGRLGWGLSARHSDNSAQVGEAASSNSYSGSLNYALTSELEGSLFGGQEFNDYNGGQQRHFWNWGGGLRWRPSERTTLSAQTTKRFFGRGFAYTVSHRMRRSVFDWSYGRDVNSSSNTGSGSFGDLAQIKAQYPAQFAAALSAVQASPSAPTDPLDQEIAAVELMKAAGIAVTTPYSGNVLTSQNYVDRRMRLAWSMVGLRNTVTLGAFSSDRETLTQTSSLVVVGTQASQDDLVRFSRVKQRGWDASWRHDLSAKTTIGLRYAYTDTSGFSSTGLRTTVHTDTWSLALDTKLGARTTGGLSFTQSRSRWSSADYRENAASIYLNHRF